MAKRNPPATGAYGEKQLEWACEAMTASVLKTLAFQIEWLKWVRYRQAEIKKPVTEVIAKRAIHKLEGWGHDRAIAAIRHSMANARRGIREL